MKTISLCIAGALMFWLSAYADQGTLDIRSAWIPEAPPTAGMLAGYLEIHNPGEATIVITGAGSAAFGMIEIHRTVQIDGVARMRRQERVEIPPGEAVRFEPGDLHLMLMQPEARLRAGDQVELHLIDDAGHEYPFTAEVRRCG